jgi:hypothetical protein
MADWIDKTQSVLGSVAEDVASLDSFFDRIVVKPQTTVAVPSKPMAVAPTPTTLATGSPSNVALVVVGVLLGLWLLG